MKFHFFAAKTQKAKQAFDSLSKEHGQHDEKDCDVIVVLGGDGTMLEALHTYESSTKAFYGVNFGSVGFLMIPYESSGFLNRIECASKATIHPLKMKATTIDGHTHEAVAFNEVSLIRETRQAATLKIMVDNVVRIPELMCDGNFVGHTGG